MAAAIPIRVSHSQAGLRPVDPARDLKAITRLIELGFGPELDPLGWRTLRRMQRLARRNPWAHLLVGPVTGLDGFVWVEDGAVVGNLSLRRAVPYSRGGWMIGNVVVAPEYRGRGIGRQLVEMALTTATSQQARWIGLEVRSDNRPARQLYESLGFEPVGEMEHLLRPAEPWPTPPPLQPGWQRSGPTDNVRWALLAEKAYPRLQREVLEIRPGAYNFGGWERTLELWFHRQRETAWLHGERRPSLAVQTHTDRAARFHTWELLVNPRTGETGCQAAIARALHVMSPRQVWPVIVSVPATSLLVSVLQTWGFQRHRLLMQMRYSERGNV